MKMSSMETSSCIPITAHSSTPSYNDPDTSYIGIVAEDVSSLLDKFEEVEVVFTETSEKCCAKTDGFSESVYPLIPAAADINIQNDSMPLKSCKSVDNFVSGADCNVLSFTNAQYDGQFMTSGKSRSHHDFSRQNTQAHWDRSFLYQNRRPQTKTRKGKLKTVETSSEQLFDKLPIYYTALSIPARAVAGSTAQSSSDLVAEFMHRQSKEDECVPVLNKIPAYQSSFTNSIQYDLDSEQLENFGMTNCDHENLEKCIQRASSSSMLYESYFSSAEIVEKGTNKTKHKSRCVVYIGRVPKNLSSNQLRTMFEQFGEIHTCSVHIREHGDSYGFVTYVHTDSAARAVDEGNAIAGCESFDICFGGRRQFCMTDYADLDGKTVVREEFTPFSSVRSESSDAVDFDDLLFMAKQERRSDCNWT